MTVTLWEQLGGAREQRASRRERDAVRRQQPSTARMLSVEKFEVARDAGRSPATGD